MNSSLKLVVFDNALELGEKVKFNVIGYGHGVGMSQTGADSMAKQGKNYEEITNCFINIRNYCSYCFRVTYNSKTSD